jgi:hypothetical protein
LRRSKSPDGGHTARAARGHELAASEHGELLSDQLEQWFADDDSRTIGDLVHGFGPRSFAVSFVVLMAFPALPLPTGGVSHALEAAAMLLALQLIAGRSEVWLPARWRGKPLRGLSGKLGRTLVRRIRWIERWARPRFGAVLELGVVRRLIGIVVFGFALAAFLAPPFSGLDTLPSLGVVVLSVGVLLHDMVVALAGVLIGALGVVLIIGLGHAVVSLF